LSVAGLRDPMEPAYHQEMKKGVLALQGSNWYEDADQDALEKHYQGADFLCVPSIVAEMAPLVILEAFRHKLPVIGSNNGGIPDMVLHRETGILFDPFLRHSLHSMLKEIASNPSMIEEMKKRIPSLPSFDRLIEEHLALYKQVMDRTKNIHEDPDPG
jgi:glycosyltransferase involved in cell wall biosynthesis